MSETNPCPRPCPNTPRRRVAPAALALALSALMVLQGCATPARDADRLVLEGRYEEAVALLEQGLARRPDSVELRSALLRQREHAAAQLAVQADALRAAGRLDEALALAARIEALSPGHARAAWLRNEVERTRRLDKQLADGRQAFERRQYERAELLLRTVLEQDPAQTAARSMLARIAEVRAEAARERALPGLNDKPVTLDFRDMPLRTVFDTLSRAGGINFVFDKDVRADQRVTLSLRDTTVDEAMRIILATQQLDRKLLNDRSVLIYPNNQQKQREHQELVTRSFYLVNTDVKQAQTMVRTMAKTRDIYIDERLNLLVVRDSPDVVRLVERLIDSIDIAEPEVMMDVQVLEVSSSTLRELGLSLPTQVNYGVPGSTAPLSTLEGLRFYGANPVALAKFNGNSSDANILANPRIRARNREKARVQIGDKLPVFTTTSTANVGTSTSVTYLDVGIKLEIEPTVLLDDDVAIKVGLEVSNVTKEVSAADGTKAYNVGTRQAATTLRLRDGQTQILAGLINDSDKGASAGIVGLNELPVLGALFGARSRTLDKSEVVLLITPHIVRNLQLPPAFNADMAAGTDTQPGAASLRLRPKASVSRPAGAGGAAAGAMLAPPPLPSSPGGVPMQGGDDAPEALSLSGPQEVLPGSSFAITAANGGGQAFTGELSFDAAVFTANGNAPGGSLQMQVDVGTTATAGFQVKADAPEGSYTFALGATTHTVNVRKPAAPATPAGGAPGTPPFNRGLPGGGR